VELTQEYVKESFSSLDDLIQAVNESDGFTGEEGKKRHDLRAHEFMLMTGNKTRATFKHWKSRNYLLLFRNWPDEPWKLQIPSENKPFLKGVFPR